MAQKGRWTKPDIIVEAVWQVKHDGHNIHSFSELLITTMTLQAVHSKRVLRERFSYKKNTNVNWSRHRPLAKEDRLARPTGCPWCWGLVKGCPIRERRQLKVFPRAQRKGGNSNQATRFRSCWTKKVRSISNSRHVLSFTYTHSGPATSFCYPRHSQFCISLPRSYSVRKRTHQLIPKSCWALKHFPAGCIIHLLPTS